LTVLPSGKTSNLTKGKQITGRCKEKGGRKVGERKKERETNKGGNSFPPDISVPMENCNT
jgi:hypothetical protein